MTFEVNSTLESAIGSSLDLKALEAIITVGIPPVSSARLMCPTDTWQTGQTGVKTTASIAWADIFVTQSGMDSFLSFS